MSKYVFILATFILTLISISAYAVPVPDTGQTKCYDADGDEISCPQSGEPFYGQDAQYSSNPPSYTKLDENGEDLIGSATSWAMVRDNVTSLIWEMKNAADGTKNYSNPHDADNIYTWFDSSLSEESGAAGISGDGTDTEDFINSLNETQFGKHTDWRLPTISELSLIIDRGIDSPAINSIFYPVPSIAYSSYAYYWSSTTKVYSPYSNDAWNVDFLWGGVESASKTHYYFVRAVRGGQTENIFVDNGDGTVTDTITDLMWQQEVSTEFMWQDALWYCENLTLSGYDDWRLPNVNELQSISDYTLESVAIDTNYFLLDLQFCFWSSTSYSVATSGAWLISFLDGRVDSNVKTHYCYVRPVRGGNVISPATTTTTIPEDGTTTTSIIDDPTSTTTTTTTTIPYQPCSIETIYGEDSEETELLKDFRDNVLSKTPEGRKLMRQYYKWSPAIVEVMESNEKVRAIIKAVVDNMLPFIIFFNTPSLAAG